MISTAALDYVRSGWRVIPIPHRTKRPTLKRWEDLRISEEDIPKHFNGKPCNIGVLLGEPSNWLIDIDLDDLMAVELASQFLPPTDAVFGRDSKPRSHYLYHTDSPVETKKWKPKTSGMILELRSTGCQTVFPGSTHTSGELIEWATSGKPAVVAPDALLSACENLYQAVLQKKGIIGSDPANHSTNGARAVAIVPRVDTIERCWRYIEKMPDAISGQGGHNATFNVACECFRFGLTDTEAGQVLSRFNDLKTGSERWAETDLAHKLNDARNTVAAAGQFACRLQENSDKGSKRKRTKKGPIKLEKVRKNPLALLTPTGKTELSNGKRFAKMHGDKVRYCEAWKAFLVWDGARWSRDSERKIEALGKDVPTQLWGEYFALAENAADEMTDELKFCKSSSSAHGISNFLALARSESGIPIQPSALDANPWVLNCANGTLDLKTGQLREHNRADYLTKLAPVEFDPAADPKIWCEFLRVTTGGNADLSGFLRRLVGFTLTGVTREHILPVLWGTGSNGKSTFVNTILALLGEDYAMKAPTDLLLAKKNESHPTERADLFGKRFVACVETEEGKRLAESLVKELTGGDKIRARRMREDFWEFSATHKIVLATNHKPDVRGTDHGIWRRLKLVPFTVVIPDERQDKTLQEKLIGELPGILNWALHGCLEWQSAGLGEPEVVKGATRDYRTEMDRLGEFIESRCVLDPSARVQGGTLYKAYKEWCEANGSKPVTSTRFGLQLKERGIDKRTGTGGYVERIGIDLVGS